MNHVANSVQDNQQKIYTHIHQIQAIIQSMQLQYAAPQPSYQYYGGYGHYRGNNGFRGNGGRCWKHADIVLDVVAGLQEVHQQETAPSEVTAFFKSIQ